MKLPIRAITFEITSTLVCMSLPLGKVYGDAVRHYKLPCPGDDAMKAAFKAAYKKTGTELPNFGVASGLNEREWWWRMIKQTLTEAGCTEYAAPLKQPLPADEQKYTIVLMRPHAETGRSSR